MSDFIYDQMVTAKDLNNIAIDLGCTDFNVFFDGTVYAVEKLNEITSSIVSSGITSALNRFEVTVNDDVIVLNTGIAIFESGKKFKLTEPLTLPVQNGELYIVENQATGGVTVCIGELPVTGYLHIATINENKTFTDRRMYAKAKVNLPTEGNSYFFNETYTVVCDGSEPEVTENYTVTISTSGITKIFVHCGNSEFYYDVESGLFSGWYNANGEGQRYSKKETVKLSHTSAANQTPSIDIKVSEKTDSNVTFTLTVKASAVGNNAGNVKYYVFGGIIE